MHRWTRAEDDFLIDNYENRKLSVKDMAKQLLVSESAIRNRANTLDLKRLGKSDIDKYIIENINKKSISEIAKDTKRAVCTIRRRAIEIKAIEKYNFRLITTKEVEAVINRYATENTFILAAELSLPVHSVRKIALKNNIKKIKKYKKPKSTKLNRWTEKEEEFIRLNHENMTAKDMAKKLGKGYNSTRHKIAYMGLKDNLKIYRAGNISFKYNTDYEKEKKLEYITSFRELLHKEGVMTC